LVLSVVLSRVSFTLRGLVAELGERELKVDYRSVWEFVHAERLSFKKRMARPVRKWFRHTII